MRRLLVAGSCLILVVALGVVLVGTAASASRKADLAVSDLAEPPQVVTPGASFRESFAVANEGVRSAKKSRTRFFLDLNPNNSAGRTRIGNVGAGRIAGAGEEGKRARLRVPAGLAAGNYFLVACADATKKIKEAQEKDNCRISGQPVEVGGDITGPRGAAGENNEQIIPRTTLAIGRPTLDGARANPAFGDDEKSTQRAQLAKVGPVSLVADCKRTTNGDNAGPDVAPTAPNDFDQDGDEAKILVYSDSGTVTFNGPGNSSRRNIPPGEGDLPGGANEPGAYTPADEVNGAEGVHMAIATQRDPDQTAPAVGFQGGSNGDWAFAYKVGTIYISHSNGTELVFTGYAGIDVLGAEDQCVFSGVLQTVKAVG